MSFCIFECPHCQGCIQVMHSEINCGIFRHAVFVGTLESVNPHASQQECSRWVEANEVVGCAKPFRVIRGEDGFSIEPCDYI